MPIPLRMVSHRIDGKRSIDSFLKSRFRFQNCMIILLYRLHKLSFLFFNILSPHSVHLIRQEGYFPLFTKKAKKMPKTMVRLYPPGTQMSIAIFPYLHCNFFLFSKSEFAEASALVLFATLSSYFESACSPGYITPRKLMQFNHETIQFTHSFPVSENSC